VQLRQTEGAVRALNRAWALAGRVSGRGSALQWRSRRTRQCAAVAGGRIRARGVRAARPGAGAGRARPCAGAWIQKVCPERKPNLLCGELRRSHPTDPSVWPVVP